MASMQDRELSTLMFHGRVLAQAEDPHTPLLERANFLGIAARGLQEFICVRLGSMTAKQRKGGGEDLRPSGLSVDQTLEMAWKQADRLMMRMDRILHEQLLPQLVQQGVRIVQGDDVTPVQMAALSSMFTRDMMPLLEPAVLEEDGDMPLLPSGQLNLAVTLEDEKDHAEKLAVVQLPETLPGLIHLAGRGQWLTVEEAVKLNLHLVFGEARIRECHGFRVLRAEHTACKSSETDVRRAVQDCLDKRSRGRILRVVCAPGMPGLMEEKLCAALKVDRSIAVRRGFMLDHARVMRALTALPDLDALRYPPYTPCRAPEWNGDPFEVIRAKDRLLCHPYDSFDPVAELLEAAARDRNVLRIHMTLYRVSRDSRILAALTDAAEHGVQVHVCVEPRARMDEARNLQLIDLLEKAGCRVYTGLGGVRVHGKALLIVRSEDGQMRRYVHLGTGNYNETTARQYTDFGLLTADEAMGEDAECFFACLEGRREQPDLQTLTASPQGMRQELLRLIRREMEKASRGEACGIACMLNALTDVEMIGTLAEAARCGVPVDLTVRGACCLIPDAGEKIILRSVMGRYLEHGRAFAFGAKGQEAVFISSADWMKRSLNRRLELLIPVKDPACAAKILCCMQARRDAGMRVWSWQDGEYIPPKDDAADVQQRLMQAATADWADA